VRASKVHFCPNYIKKYKSVNRTFLVEFFYGREKFQLKIPSFILLFAGFFLFWGVTFVFVGTWFRFPSPLPRGQAPASAGTGPRFRGDRPSLPRGQVSVFTGIFPDQVEGRPPIRSRASPRSSRGQGFRGNDILSLSFQ